MEPDRAEPELTALELRNGAYEQVARVSRDEPFAAQRPFSVSIGPAALVALG